MFKLAELINTAESNAVYLNLCYIQTADIDLENKPWIPIGNFLAKNTENKPVLHFEGRYDGNYHKIINLNCSENGSYRGLFGRLGENNRDCSKTSIVSNLSVWGTVKSDSWAVGGIAGELCSGATIKNCSFIGDVTGSGTVGGLAGMTHNGAFIYNSYHNGNVTATSNQAGGLIGGFKAGQYEFSCDGGIYNSYHVGTVKSSNGNSGAIVGYLEYGEKNKNVKLTFDNNYYLDTSCSGAVNGQNMNGCIKLNETLMKSAEELLGSPFTMNDNDSVNNGFPVFEWQITPFKGNGTESDPYQISASKDLFRLSELVNNASTNKKYAYCCYIQTADIDMNNELFTPIGKPWKDGNYNDSIRFYGKYDGNFKKVKNLKIDIDSRYVGVFGYLDGADVTNLSVYGSITSTVTSESIKNITWCSTGGITGQLSNGHIRNCSFNGTIKSDKLGIGGIAGEVNRGGTIENCYFNGEIDGHTAKNIGGITGFVTSDHGVESEYIIRNNYAAGKIKDAVENFGGIIGMVNINNSNAVLKFENNYYLNTMTNAGANGSYTQGCIKLNEKVMKSAEELLGSPFVANIDDSVNDGYPVFEWQISLIGDINKDGAITVNDAVLMQKYLHSKQEFTKEQYTNADINRDGKVNVYDMILMKRELLEKK